MDQDRDIAFQDVLPTDKFAIQDMFLLRIHKLGVVYQRIMQPYHLSHGRDPRAIADFSALADEFFIFAQSNIEKHLTTKEVNELSSYFDGHRQMGPAECRRIYTLFMKFCTKSKLTELSEKRYLGSFAYARKEMGMRGRKQVTE